MIKLFIKKNENYSKPLEYILRTLAKNKLLSFAFIDEKNEARIIFDHSDSRSIPINLPLFDSLLQRKVYNHEFYFPDEPRIIFPDSRKPDWLGTAFYMINALQEYGQGDVNDSSDQYGRFRFDRSYQYRYNCIDQNLVQICFDQFCSEHALKPMTSKKGRATRVFLSHDIDTIHGSFLQDGMWAIKNGSPDIILKLVMNEVLLNPHWKNIDRISKLHTEHDLKSTFFWLATRKIAENGIKNADYTIEELRGQSKFSSSNGLHKSSYTTSFSEELQTLPFTTNLNRYHFLKFTLPSAWKSLEGAGIKFDASLGFAEQYGFRNSYGLPFQPYNLNTGSPYPFVEVPLNIMDGTLHRYMNIPLKDTATTIIDFMEKNSMNCIISILWHNTYFTSYKYGGYLEEYKKVLLYLNERGITSITPEEIINEYGNE
ncbi:MAG: hypothetical protein ABJB16_08605 [Saprospiraceae bacterium]